MKTYRAHDLEARGRIERVNYAVKDKAGVVVYKYANVYLPYEYDAEPQKKYNVLYVMHGGGGNPDAWLDSCMTKNMLDFSFSEEGVDPFIVVFPTYYIRGRQFDRDGGPGSDGDMTHDFQKELREVLMPAVEGKYRTYAEGITEADFVASRKHRAFSGFSMGSVTTWYAFQENLKVIADFVPLSGDSWIIENKGGCSKTVETVAALCDVVKASGLTKDDFRIFAATGTEDIAHPNLTPQVEEMKKFPEIFDYNEDYTKGNFHYLLKEDYAHNYPAVCEYLYNYVPYLFKY